jgi:hypothetical protein
MSILQCLLLLSVTMETVNVLNRYVRYRSRMSFVVDVVSEDSFYENLTLGLVRLLGK